MIVNPISKPFKYDYLETTVINCQVKITCGDGPTKSVLFNLYLSKDGFLVELKLLFLTSALFHIHAVKYLHSAVNQNWAVTYAALYAKVDYALTRDPYIFALRINTDQSFPINKHDIFFSVQQQPK